MAAASRTGCSAAGSSGGIVTLQDGFPFTVQCGGGTIQNGGGICYPDATGEDWRLSGSERTRTRYFNTDAFADRNPSGRSVPLRHRRRATRSSARASSAWTRRANKRFHCRARATPRFA